MAVPRHTRRKLTPSTKPIRKRNSQALSPQTELANNRATSLTSSQHPHPPLQFSWADAISESEWDIYRFAIRALRSANIPFVLAGGFALATYTGRWRDTKDIDFYVNPQDAPKAVSALTEAGFNDYFKTLPYDRKWIYRSVRENIIVDIIWAMANQRAQVDHLWFDRAGSVSIRGEQLRVIPMEELCWCKLYIMQRDHCDWTDLFNLLYAQGPAFDWSHLLKRLENDAPVLRGLLSVYGWLCPEAASKLPDSLWECMSLPDPKTLPTDPRFEPVKLLDSRSWFGAVLDKGEKLQV